MMQYLSMTERYDANDVSLKIMPDLPYGAKQHVLVTHDESTFYANDHQRYAWVDGTERSILPKSPGRSIMISEFQCPCHVTMRAVINGKEMISRVVFYPGAAHQGYWTSEHMLNQLRDVIVLFDFLHEGMTAVFLFDQSSNHKAFAGDALVANRMNLKPHVVGKDDVRVRNGYYSDGTGVIEQSFYKDSEYDYGEAMNVHYGKKSTAWKRQKQNEIVRQGHPVSYNDYLKQTSKYSTYRLTYYLYCT